MIFEYVDMLVQISSISAIRDIALDDLNKKSNTKFSSLQTSRTTKPCCDWDYLRPIASGIKSILDYLIC